MSSPKLFATLVLLSVCLQGRAGEATPIIPQPLKVEAHDGYFRLKSTDRIVADSGLKNEARLLVARLRTGTGMPFRVKGNPAEAADEDIVERVQSSDQIELLEDQANLAARDRQLAATQRSHGVLAEENLPAIGLREARHAAEQCGLSGTAGSEYRDDLTRRHFERNII